MKPTNGSHLADVAGYFEWWYFHFLSDGGLIINFLLHASDVFSQDRDPYYSMSVLKPDGTRLYYRQHLPGNAYPGPGERLSFSTRTCSVSETDEQLFLKASFRDASLDVAITRLDPPVIIEQGLLLDNPESGVANYWIVPFPLGSYTGTIELGGSTYQQSGRAYHDHNWGTASIPETVSRWLWGHCHILDGYLIYYFIERPNGDTVGRGAFSGGGKARLSTHLNVSRLRFEDSSTVGTYPRSYEVELQLGDGSVKAAVATESMFRMRRDLHYQGFTTTYYRATSSVLIQAGMETIGAWGLAEYMRIERGET
jgi:hypothetical protein